MMHKTPKTLAPYTGSRVKIELRSGIKFTGMLEADTNKKRFWVGNNRFTPGQILSIDRAY